MAVQNKEVKKCLKIAQSIAHSQGGIFIRELLREKQKIGIPVKIGADKESSLKNLYEAILQQQITLDDLQEWVLQVEGWGKQHVYLYVLPEQFVQGKTLGNLGEIEKAILASKYSKYLGADDDYSFPHQLKLRQILVAKDGLEIVWKRRTAGTVRDEKKDPPKKTINGDNYEFRAYRVTPARSVMRFLVRPDLKMAAMFIQLPLGEEHADAFRRAEQIMKEVFSLKALTRLKMSMAIKKLDGIDLKASGQSIPKLEAHRTKFTTQGASVEFSADTNLTGWKQVASVRRVRKSLKIDDFEGESGSFNVHLSDVKGMKRTIQMAISGKTDRIYFRAQMTAEEILNLLCQIEAAAN